MRAIEGELKRFDPELLKRPRWLVFNKADLLAPEEREKTAKAIVRKLKWKAPVVSRLGDRARRHVAARARRSSEFFDEQKRAAAEAEA